MDKDKLMTFPELQARDAARAAEIVAEYLVPVDPADETGCDSCE